MDRLSSLVLGVIGPCVELAESFSYIGVNTHFVKHPVMDAKVHEIAASIGMDDALIKYTIALFAIYPFCAILYSIKSKKVKHLFSFAVGFLLMQWIYGPDWIHSFIVAVGTYLIALLLPARIQPKVAFFFVMGYMVCSHIYRMYVSYMTGIFDFTGTQMVLTMKLTSFAYNYYDGTHDKKKVFPPEGFDPADKKAKVYQDRAKYAITKLPGLLEYFGYVYCFTCILAGPAFEYKDYERSIDGTAFRTNAKDEKSPIKKPSTLIPGLKNFVIGAVMLVLYMQFNARWSSKLLHNKEFIATVPYLKRWGVLMLAMLGDRFKFYFAWKIAEGASIMGGFGFQGYTADGKEIGWKGVENIDIAGFETAPCLQNVTRAWNKRTQGWLERYTYHRSGRSLIMTYFISALWHGLYPGFFIMFMTVPLMTQVERLIKSKLNPIFCPGYDGFKPETYPKGTVATVYWVVCWFCTMNIMNYVVQVFPMGSLENSLTALGGHYFWPHIMLTVAYFALQIFPSPHKHHKKEASGDSKEGKSESKKSK